MKRRASIRIDFEDDDGGVAGAGGAGGSAPPDGAAGSGGADAGAGGTDGSPGLICGNGVVDPGESCDPPSPFGWVPGHGSPLYCGMQCTLRDACAECHQQCDADPAGFAACAAQRCKKGQYLPCG